MNRQEIFSALKSNPNVSVLIVGGGINGIGVFRDLALNGVDVLLVERGDFCSGASSASSHMAHGGIRYLENGEFRLVREAVRERNHLIQNAPHLVKSLPTTIPIFKQFSGLLNAPRKFLRLLDKPSERGASIIKIGLMIYDSYNERSGAVSSHRFLNRDQSLARWSDLNPNVVATATYYDGAILSPERLAMETLLDAEAENSNARALNYASMVHGRGDTVVLRDELTDENYEVKPRLLINATGAWIDFVNEKFGHTTHFIGGTKGSHLVLKHDELRKAIGEHEFYFENKDGRFVFILPLYERVLIGTSDLPIENPDEAHCTDEETEYFLEMIGRVFPKIKVAREHIVFQYSGVRPLEHSGAKNAGQITRDHNIRVISGEWTELAFPVYSLVGGKWTPFRAFAEQVTDKSLEYLGLKRQKDTRALPIGGGRGYPRTNEERNLLVESLSAWTGLSIERLRALFESYGTRTQLVAEFICRSDDAPLVSLPAWTRREVMFLALHEKVIHLDDLLLRRSTLAMLGKLDIDIVEEMAEVLSEALEWDEARRQAEVARTLSILADKHGVRL
ncbi:MAG TPA: glycerol-3-phosphate dehydrogenase/oxidase [Anaerolineales bacterium]|nr:glycerol-3-phosphate dehydrogenase/oxidase [Anaerolineales bacterium]